jgi:hypothetical protein
MEAVCAYATAANKAIKSGVRNINSGEYIKAPAPARRGHFPLGTLAERGYDMVLFTAHLTPSKGSIFLLFKSKISND